jgi:hypothetical protein
MSPKQIEALKLFDFSSGAPMLKAWPEGAVIVRPGDRVRVTWQRLRNGKPGGTIEGIARNVDRGGFFDVFPDAGCGEPRGFFAGDSWITVQIVGGGAR